MNIFKIEFRIFFLILFISSICQAQFLDNFDKNKIEGWKTYTGDGSVEMKLIQKDGFARIAVDATNDKHNIWWTIIKRNISPYIDLAKLADPDYELRVEARVRASQAPRRVNFMINTQRTINFHKQLMEYEIPDTTGWHVISYITHDLDAVPGDSLYVQLDVTDWGIGKYHLDVDYYRAEVINIKNAEPDKGEPLPYHPPVPEPDVFTNHIDVEQDGILNMDFPEVNFNNWHVTTENDIRHILTVDKSQWVILRWDLSRFKNGKIEGLGLLELTTQSLAIGGKYIEAYGEDFGIEFGKVRVFEIFGGNPEWDQNDVTFNSFFNDKPLAEVINSQMIIDVDIDGRPGSKNYITLSRPVLQRLIDGKTKGLLLRPLGALNASFISSEDQNASNCPKLHFNVKK
ncbi:MAG: hypothetical protein P8X42_05850 [Calditrichaceae bacterium]